MVMSFAEFSELVRIESTSRSRIGIAFCRDVECPNEGGSIMRLVTIAMTGFVLFGMVPFALANPAMLPDHPGYPARGEFSNDTGQRNLTNSQSLLDAAASGSVNMGQKLEDPNNARLLERQGAGQFPSVQGPNIKIEPPVKEGTRMTN